MANIFDDWVRGESLGEGGQAWTYKAHNQNDSERTVYVIKLLKHKSSANRLKRFEREIEAGRRLSHPNVVRFVDQNIQHVKPYVVMEYCSGRDLKSLNISQLSLLEKLKMFWDVCKGVGHAHENGVIHRDLKPNNIFLRADYRTPVVGDFGLCLLTELDERLTETTEAVGARLYMAPELEDGRYEDASPIADVYSLGKILYWLVSNKRMFSREKHANEIYDLRREDQSAAMAFVYEILDDTIEAAPEKRKYSNASKLADAVETIINRITVGAHAIKLEVSQQCSYCGTGTYQIILDGDYQKVGFETRGYHLGISLKNVPGQKWLILACDYCGNLQFFRADMAAKNPKAWTSESNA